MDPVVGILVLGAYGLLVGAVGFVIIYLERRQIRKHKATQEAGREEARA